MPAGTRMAGAGQSKRSLAALMWSVTVASLVAGGIFVRPGGAQTGGFRFVVSGFMELGKHHLYVVDSEDGRHLKYTQVTDGDDDITPRWAPDGLSVAYAMRGQKGYEIRILSMGTLASRSLVTDSGDSRSPAWSPDGRSLVYASRRGGTYDLWIETLATGQARQLTDDEGDEVSPTWAPDGREVAYIGGGKNGVEILAVDVESGRRRLLVPTEGSAMDPVWSPDGTRIAYVADTGVEPAEGKMLATRRYDVFVHDLTRGTDVNVSRCTGNERQATSPAWSPDGNKIAFLVLSYIRVHDLRTGEMVTLPNEIGLSMCCSGNLSWASTGD